MSPRPLFGGHTLGHPATTRLLQRLWPDDEAELEAIRQRERNDEIFTRAIRRCWKDGLVNPLHGWGEKEK